MTHLRRPLGHLNALLTAGLLGTLLTAFSPAFAASGSNAMTPMTPMSPMSSMPSMSAAAPMQSAPAMTAGTPQAAPQQDWTGQVEQARIGRRTPMTLVLHAAKDCKYCKMWEGDGGGMHDFQAWAATHKHTKLVIIDRSAIANPELAMDYPPAQRWMFTRDRAAGFTQPLTPTFDVYVGTKLVWRTSGLDSWNQGVFPAIKQLDAKRGQRGKKATPAATSAAAALNAHS